MGRKETLKNTIMLINTTKHFTGRCENLLRITCSKLTFKHSVWIGNFLCWYSNLLQACSRLACLLKPQGIELVVSCHSKLVLKKVFMLQYTNLKATLLFKSLIAHCYLKATLFHYTVSLALQKFSVLHTDYNENFMQSAPDILPWYIYNV